MKIALIGASGFVGSAVLDELLNRGYEVTAIVRNPEKITKTDGALKVAAADVFDTVKLSEIITGHDAVISAYNSGWANTNLYNDFIKGSGSIEEATKTAGLKRLLVVGGAGSLEIAPGVQLVDTPDFPAEYKAGATAARDYLNILRKDQDLEWTFLSPPMFLQPGERTAKFRIGTDQPVFDQDQHNAISVADLAVAIVNEIENNNFIRQRFTVGY